MKQNTNVPSRKGVTLIELSVVIAVILVLISVLFIGAQYYRDSSNNAACVVVQSSIRKAAESYMNIDRNADTVTITELSADGAPFDGNPPSCPTAGTNAYTLETADGQVTSLTCSDGHG